MKKDRKRTAYKKRKGRNETKIDFLLFLVKPKTIEEIKDWYFDRFGRSKGKRIGQLFKELGEIHEEDLTIKALHDGVAVEKNVECLIIRMGKKKIKYKTYLKNAIRKYPELIFKISKKKIKDYNLLNDVPHTFWLKNPNKRIVIEKILRVSIDGEFMYSYPID